MPTVAMTNLPAEEGEPLPPFRSSKEFPISPKLNKVVALYPECFQALTEANNARRILRVRMDKKREMIVEIRKEIERLELDLALEADTRMRLHSMNEMLVDALREIQETTDEFSKIVDEAQGVSRTGMGSLIEKLKSLVRHWRDLKVRQQRTMAPAGTLGHDGASDG
jgi:hypothetical protein